MARLYGYGSLSDDELDQLDAILAPIELERISAETGGTIPSPSRAISADLFKTQRMHIGNFPQKESEITLSIVDVQSHTFTGSGDAKTVTIDGAHSIGIANVKLIGLDVSMQFVNSNASFTGSSFVGMRVGHETLTHLIITNVTVDEHVGIEICDPNKSGSTLTNNIGLEIQTMDSGSNNFAIKTNNGLVQFGENVTIAGTLGVTGAITGITAEEVGAGTFPTGRYIFTDGPIQMNNTTALYIDSPLQVSEATLNEALILMTTGASGTAAGTTLVLTSFDGLNMADLDVLGRISFQGAKTGAPLFGIGAEIAGVVDDSGNWATGSTGGALIFSTTLDGASSVTERMRIPNSGKVLIGTSIEANSGDALYMIQAANTVNGPRIDLRLTDTTISDNQVLGGVQFTGDETGSDWSEGTAIFGQAGEAWDSSNHAAYLSFYTTNTSDAFAERMRIAADGDVGIGVTPTARLHVKDNVDIIMIVESNQSSGASNGAIVTLMNDDGAAMGSGHELGRLQFRAARDASSTINTGAYMLVDAEALWTSTSCPARFEWFTTPSGSVNPTIRMSLVSTGFLKIDALTASSDVQTDVNKFLVSVSDERLKIAKRPLRETVMPKLMQIIPTRFRYRHEADIDLPEENPNQLGFLAQNVAAQWPEIAPKSEARDPGTGELISDLYGFNSRAMLAVVVKGMQELNERLELLEVA